MTPQKIHLREYLTRSQMTGNEPSFFHTLAYLEFAGAEAWSNPMYTWVTCEGWIMFPPLLTSGSGVVYNNPLFPKGDIWCNDIDNNYVGSGAWHPQFLDWEYVFDPTDFNDMAGGKWNTFRKNVRKWPRENPEWVYTDELQDWTALSVLMGEWMEGRADKAEDAELMLKYVFSSRQDVKKNFMYNGVQTPGCSYGELVGVNVWDWNWKYINYDLCVVKEGERFLDEFMRYSFYIDPEIFQTGKLVNDGGSLGREGLERFKDKMNPRIKHQRYSLIKGNKK